MQVVHSLLQYNCDAGRQWQGPGGQSCSLLGVALRHGHTALLPLLADVGAVCTRDDLADLDPELASAIAGDCETSILVRRLTTEPRSLQQLCRQRIRSRLSCDIRHEVNWLPLPNRLRQFIVQV